MTNDTQYDGCEVYFPFSSGKYDTVVKKRLASKPSEEEIKNGEKVRVVEVRKNYKGEFSLGDKIWIDLNQAYMIKSKTYEIGGEEDE